MAWSVKKIFVLFSWYKNFTEEFTDSLILQVRGGPCHWMICAGSRWTPCVRSLCRMMSQRRPRWWPPCSPSSRGCWGRWWCWSGTPSACSSRPSCRGWCCISLPRSETQSGEARPPIERLERVLSANERAASDLWPMRGQHHSNVSLYTDQTTAGHEWLSDNKIGHGGISPFVTSRGLTRSTSECGLTSVMQALATSEARESPLLISWHTTQLPTTSGPVTHRQSGKLMSHVWIKN